MKCGKIIRGIAGFYYVLCEDSIIYECKAKGSFRKDQTKPLVGDNVMIQVLDEEHQIGNIEKIETRINSLIRPNVANVDQAMVIFALKKPTPNFNLLDRFMIMMQQQNIETIICFNKVDLSNLEEINELETRYLQCAKKVIFCSAKQMQNIEQVRRELEGKTTVVAGPRGVGKSSLINLLQDTVNMQIGSISQKIERGKHTTRHSELITINGDTFIMDTPGFSSLHLFDLEKEELQRYFPEFHEYQEQCRFLGCSHTHEPDCGVKIAVEQGIVDRNRYDNYCLLYKELSEKRKY